MGFTIFYDILDNPPDSPYGRHVVHDSRSWDHRTARRPRKPTKASLCACHLPPWDQGNIGDCTANAGLGMMITDPFWTPVTPKFAERDCVQFYIQETRLDDVEIPGHYPPEDTGSSGLYMCRLLKRMGLVTGYETAFGLTAVLNTLAGDATTPPRPVALGTLWMDSMEEPDSSGLMKISPGAQSVGGHEWLAIGQDPDKRQIKMRQSWGDDWGDHGYGYLGWDDLDDLLEQNGDAYTGALPKR